MPPEQLDIETGTVDERADVFALACSDLRGLCGSAPFMAATPADSLGRIIGGATYPSELIPHFPRGAEAAPHERALPMPQDRPNSIEAFCDQLLPVWAAYARGSRSLEQMVGEAFRDDEQELDDIESVALRGTIHPGRPALAGGAGEGALLHHARYLGANGGTF